MFMEGFLDAFCTKMGGAKLRKYELYPTYVANLIMFCDLISI